MKLNRVSTSDEAGKLNKKRCVSFLVLCVIAIAFWKSETAVDRLKSL
jgi:hypothetical protein